MSKKNQISNLNNLIKSRRLGDQTQVEQWTEEYISKISPVYTVPQQGTSEADRIDRLPGQPEADFDHYAGYVTVDVKAERALFYYFAESPHNSSTNPLVLWLNGGPGCSSFGYGAMEELGPFRVNSDGKTLYRNDYAWNNVANVLFLESPVGVGFSYSNRSSDYTTGDKRTSEDSYTFLINWLERFPQYKSRNFYITGESYAGHFVPQLASLILSENKKRNQTIINLKGIAIGNPQIDYRLLYKENFDYLWTHALNSDETNAGINKYCDFESENYSVKCYEYLTQSDYETGDIDSFNIYAPLCDDSTQQPEPLGCVMNYDPCSDGYVATYLNLAEVQEALHARTTSWEHCITGSEWTDRPITILPIIKQLSEKGIMVWIFSGDLDTVITVTSTRHSVSKMKLPLETAWRPWYSNKQVGGHLVGYKGVVLTTVRGAGHQVPSYQPESALVMISSFLQGILPPSLKE